MNLSLETFRVTSCQSWGKHFTNVSLHTEKTANYLPVYTMLYAIRHEPSLLRLLLIDMTLTVADI